MTFLAPGVGLAQTWLLKPFAEIEDISVCVCVSPFLCHSTIKTNKSVFFKVDVYFENIERKVNSDTTNSNLSCKNIGLANQPRCREGGDCAGLHRRSHSGGWLRK